DQDKFALQTYEKAKNAQENAEFLGEIVPVIFKDEPLTRDETLLKIKPEKIPTLRPAFSKDGTITAASSSSIADGAAAILLASEEALKEHNLTPLFKITGMSQHSHGPEWFTTAPVGAMKKLFDQLSLSPDQVDAFEVNEAFAVVTMAAIHDLKLPTEKVNQRGGACALGHPIGASGARILTTLCHLMQDKSYKTGMATLCIGGGEAVAIAIESV
ncbi:MAG TPA: thiolase family protein, partial [Alphaproteobacteria bacterium]|nr:thiolase family protein [Alphaproteobacteria bacterium]